MVEGETYALEVAGADQCVPVTVSSIADAPQGKVNVRGEGDQDVQVPCRRIRCEWRRYRAGKVILVDTQAFDDIAWFPGVGEVVERHDVHGRWTVVEVDLPEMAILKGEIATRPVQESVPIDRIRPAERLQPGPSENEIDEWLSTYDLAPQRREAPAEGEVSVDNGDDGEATDAPSGSNDIRPEAMAKRLVFGPEACRQYRKLEPRCGHGDEANRMRREIKNWSKPLVLRKRSRLRGEFIRYLVPARFSVVIFGNPRDLPYDIDINQIRVVVQKKQKKESPTASAQKRKSRNRRGKRRRRPRPG
jgi:hypothetical protein